MERYEGKKVLVVDDSAPMRMLIAMTLRRSLAGLSVTEAYNGLDAMEKLRDQKFDLVLTDMNMPGMDGAQLIRSIRGSMEHIPIAVITTMGEDKDRDYGLSLGADGYITKPVTGGDLRGVVRRFLRGREE
jgi:two-component system chemotaxis response regulator CheY